MKDGMGWLGWSYDETLDTPIPIIELAMRGKFEMLKAIHGAADMPPAPQAEPPPPPSPADFKAAFRAAIK